MTGSQVRVLFAAPAFSLHRTCARNVTVATPKDGPGCLVGVKSPPRDTQPPCGFNDLRSDFALAGRTVRAEVAVQNRRGMERLDRWLRRRNLVSAAQTDRVSKLVPNLAARQDRC